MAKWHGQTVYRTQSSKLDSCKKWQETARFGTCIILLQNQSWYRAILGVPNDVTNYQRPACKYLRNGYDQVALHVCGILGQGGGIYSLSLG